MKKAVQYAIITLLLIAMLSSSILSVEAQKSSTQNTWVTKAQMHTPRGDLGVAAVNGKIYAIGGIIKPAQYDPAAHTSLPLITPPELTDANEEYDPATNTWSIKADIPTARAEFATAVIGNRIFCIGGESQTSYRAATEVYDTQTNNWTGKAALPIDVESPLQAVVIQEKIYVTSRSANYVYDPLNNNWTEFASISLAINGSFCCSTFDNKLYVISSPFIQIYDPATGNWTKGSQIPVALTQPIAVATYGVDAPKRIYVFDGSIAASYDPQTTIWEAGSSLPSTQTVINFVKTDVTNQGHFGVAVINDRIYVVGGQGEGYTQLPTNQEYLPIGYGTIAPEITVAAPAAANYSTSNITLAFTINKPVNSTVLQLDNQNQTIQGNYTLTNLQNGPHTIVLYATDTLGNTGASQSVTFNVAAPIESQGLPLPLLYGFCVAIVAVGVVLVLYFKRKHY
jgi:Uncharacterized protein conserved in bacteria